MQWPRAGRHVRRLEEVLARAASEVAPGSKVVVHAASGMAEGQGFYLTRWTAYLWPDRDVLWASGSPVEGPVEAWLTHGGVGPGPGRREIAASGALRVDVPDDGP